MGKTYRANGEYKRDYRNSNSYKKPDKIKKKANLKNSVEVDEFQNIDENDYEAFMIHMGRKSRNNFNAEF